MTITRDNIGAKIKEYRKSKNLSVPDVERLLGIPRDRIYKWEKGTVPYDTADFEKVKDFINGKFVEKESLSPHGNNKDDMEVNYAVVKMLFDEVAVLKAKNENISKINAVEIMKKRTNSIYAETFL